MIFDLSIIGRNEMDGARRTYEMPNSKHQTEAPPRGWESEGQTGNPPAGWESEGQISVCVHEVLGDFKLPGVRVDSTEI